MKIVLMSDSHGNSQAIKEVIYNNTDADYFYHVGDVCDDIKQFPNVSFVRGNNDYYGDLPNARTISIGKHKIYMTHSHRIYGFGSDRRKQLAALAKKYDCDMVFYGHTHIYDDTTVNGVRILNPGSLYYNRDGSDASYMVIEFDENDVKITRKSL